VDAAVDLIGSTEPALVYLYWGDVDAAGHQFGWQSRSWRQALRRTSQELARLARRLRPGTLLLVTADHGMIDVPHQDRLDLAQVPELTEGVSVLGGEGRFAQAYCEPDADPAVVADRLRDVIGDRAWVRTRDQAVTEGWFGPVDDRVRGRIGDVVVAGTGPFTLVDSRTATPHVLKLIGQHGSLTAAEQLVPLLIHQC
jgi:hypothetical protein